MPSPPLAPLGSSTSAQEAAGLFSARYRAVTIGLVSIVTLMAFESLAVITILPVIEADLRGIAWYGWVTSAFFLGTLVGIVFAGGQADRHGLGRPYVIGLVVFAVGLIVAGAAPAMPALVLGRFIQGLGAGVVPAIGYVAIGRVLPVDLRPRMFAVLSTAWVVPGIIGPALSERVSTLIGWRWVFLGLLPLIVVAGSLVLPAMMRLGASATDALDNDDSAQGWWRRRMVEAVRITVGAALVVAGLTQGGWWLLPMVAAGVWMGFGPLRRLNPPGTLTATPGLPAVILSRGMVAFAFFGTDTFVPYALTAGRGASTFAGSVAVTVATLGWVVATWVQQRYIVRTGEGLFVQLGFVALSVGISTVAATAAFGALPFWVIHVGAGMAGFGIGLAYSAHAQATLRVAPEAQYGKATASLHLCDNLGVALGAGCGGAVVALGDKLDWTPGSTVGLALLAPIAVAALGAGVVSRRFPAPSSPDSATLR